MEPTNIQGVLMIKGWDLATGYCHTYRLFLWGISSGISIPRMQEERGERRERGDPKVPVKLGRLLEKRGEAGNNDIMGWRPRAWGGGTREERVGEGH